MRYYLWAGCYMRGLEENGTFYCKPLWELCEIDASIIGFQKSWFLETRTRACECYNYVRESMGSLGSFVTVLYVRALCELDERHLIAGFTSSKGCPYATIDKLMQTNKAEEVETADKCRHKGKNMECFCCFWGQDLVEHLLLHCCASSRGTWHAAGTVSHWFIVAVPNEEARTK